MTQIREPATVIPVAMILSTSSTECSCHDWNFTILKVENRTVDHRMLKRGDLE